MEEYFFAGCIRKGKVFVIKGQEDAFVLFCQLLKLIGFVLNFIFVADDIMSAFFSVTIAINVGY